jgi:hypothetical protein
VDRAVRFDVREAVRLIPLRSRDFGAGFEVLLFTGLLGVAGLAMIVPLFIPSRWRRPSPVPGAAASSESTLAEPAVTPGMAVAPGTGGPDPDVTTAGFTAPSGGDSNVLPDRAQTGPQQGPVIPPSGSQAPPDQG